ncbi:MAG: aryl sulfotransferase [Thermoleophilaceae bacterium]|jgi:hypothetical protein|nr:aryl sulfotransferase [Thermoleophilaceae bacterium]
MTTVLIVVAVALALALITAVVTMIRFQRWFIREISGTSFFGRPAAERLAFAHEVRQRGRVAGRLLTWISRARGGQIPDGVDYDGTTAPLQCRREDFERAVSYEPRAGDVFVVTQMKCGTTWMKQIVYEILMRGRGDLSDDGGRHIYGVSSWIESSWGVPMGQTPELGPERMRLIKSHMPATLLPIGEEAFYIYVTRHPAACFASCVDFIGSAFEPILPPRAGMLDWFCSERMWWGPWPDHVESWWRQAEERPNVLFFHFEEMRADLAATVDRVAALLGVRLSDEERGEVIRKSGFDYMKAHEERFTMAPPTAFSRESTFLVSGSAERHRDVSPAERQRIAEFCRARFEGATYPFERFYPDLAANASE